MVPRLNYVLMVVLSVGLLFGVTALAVTFSGNDKKTEVTDEQIAALVNRLANSDEDVVLNARRSLLRIGVDALPRLERAVRSENPEVCRHAGELIRLIKEPRNVVEP